MSPILVRVVLTGSVVLSLMVGFQNCGPAGVQEEATANIGGSNPTVAERVIGSTQNYKKIIFDPLLGLDSHTRQASMPHLELDVEDGKMQISKDGSLSQCVMDSQRLEALRTILGSARVCVPPSLGPNEARCMAIGVPDIQLADSTKNVFLRPNICQSGVFLCDGLDETFREILADLRDHPPEGCAAP